MTSIWTKRLVIAVAFLFALQVPSYAQSDAGATQTASADAGAADAGPPPLTEDELEILVARIALYPDELVALISAASLYPLQIVEAGRFLDDYEKDNSLQPKETWDGSVISLLNYPEIVRMMSDDLEWTQALGDAIAYQQKDVLIAIQQLREKAVADGIIQTDDKVTVTEDEGDNIVIQPTNTEVIYVPQYEPQVLYVDNYPPAPIVYYPDPYPNYYYPTATFFAGFVTGAAFAAIVDWNDWGVWGGRWGNDVNINCNNCFNNRNYNGRINVNDVDWRNVDRTKINFDKNQINNIDRSKFKNDIKRNNNNSVRNRADQVKRQHPSTRPANANRSRDVRKSTMEGLQGSPGDRGRPAARPGGGNKQASTRPAKRPSSNRPAAKRPASSNKKATTSRPSGKKKPAAKVDSRSSIP